MTKFKQETPPDQVVGNILDERGERYGDYTVMSHEIRALQNRFHACEGWLCMSDGQQHALDMIAVKIGRILTGDPDYVDNWRDIEGYARLVAEQLGK